MNQLTQTTLRQCLLLIVLTVVGQGQGSAVGSTNDKEQYSDRKGAQRFVEELENLPTGKDREFYGDALEKQGYQIAEVDIDTPQLWEVEAVKNNKSIVLTIEFDPESQKSTQLTASRQRWLSNSRELYLSVSIHNYEDVSVR